MGLIPILFPSLATWSSAWIASSTSPGSYQGLTLHFPAFMIQFLHNFFSHQLLFGRRASCLSARRIVEVDRQQGELKPRSGDWGGPRSLHCLRPPSTGTFPSFTNVEELSGLEDTYIFNLSSQTDLRSIVLRSNSNHQIA